MDYTVVPPRVVKLHYEIEDWAGDALICSVDTFLVTKKAEKEIKTEKLTGVTFEKARVTKSDVFKEIKPGVSLPRFVWLIPTGKAGVDDFGMFNRRLIISNKTLDLLQQLGLPRVREIKPFRE